VKRLILTLARDPAIFVRAAYGMVLYGLGLVLGLFIRQPSSTGRPRVAFQSYAVHQALFYETLIQRLLRDDSGRYFLYHLAAPGVSLVRAAPSA
jgi:hypothetical protein